jgi:hypothetical protein
LDDPQRVAWVGDAATGRFDQPKLAVHRRRQHHTAVAGHAAAAKATLHDPSVKTAEIDHANVSAFGTVWFRHRSLAYLVSTPR